MNLDNIELDFFDFLETQHFRYGVYEDENLNILVGELIEFDETTTIFARPSSQRTEDYITGRFG